MFNNPTLRKNVIAGYVYYIGNLEFAKLVPGEAHFYNLDGDEIEKQTTEIKWDNHNGNRQCGRQQHRA